MTNNMTCQDALHQEAAGYRNCCSIVPSYILKDIAKCNTVTQEVRDIANKSLAHMATIHHARTSTQGAAIGPSAVGAVPRPLHRKIYDAHQHGINRLPGTLVFAENGAGTTGAVPTDESARNVYEHFKKVFEFYRKVFNRNSYDGNGANLVASVHFDGDPNPGYDNAFWLPDENPSKSQFAYGDGDFMFFDNFTNILDITGHEVTHAVTESTGILPYINQSGALNESISDVFGSMIKQFHAPGGPQKAKDADWLIGKGLWLPGAGPNARALRDMENPGTAYHGPRIGKDPQPATMDDYVELPNTQEDDSGGVHINSGIPNRAFVLAAKALGGHSWDVAGQIWYASLTDPDLRKIFLGHDGKPITNSGELERLSMNRFKTFADLTIKHAQTYSPEAVAAVKNAWKGVKVLV
ncbi:Translation initiation factor 3 subunit b [Podila horticola]|nr:Translation initiation factor 3 subunit b [Podila horticola]